MTTDLIITNDGPEIRSTNYWDTEAEAAGKIMCSVNAGAIRILLPRSRAADATEMTAAKYVICSRGPWPAAGKRDAVELLWEDRSQNPFCYHLSAESFDMLPARPSPGKKWRVIVYTLGADGSPNEAGAWPCRWRKVQKIPYLQPWRR